nr:MAG TPA: hypothetical protein [Caudoviricetes sp.]
MRKSGTYLVTRAMSLVHIRADGFNRKGKAWT